MKVFISQPMDGRSDEEVFAERAEVMDLMRGEHPDEEVLPVPSFLSEVPPTAGPLYMLGESIKLMEEADVVCFVPGWREARGCRIERACAAAYGKRIITLKKKENE